MEINSLFVSMISCFFPPCHLNGSVHICLFTGVYKYVLCERTGMPLSMSIWRFLWTEKNIFNSWHYSPTHSSHVSVDHELHKFVQGLILTKLLIVINLSYTKLWLMAAGFWWGCRCLDGMTKIESGLCVLRWENPWQQNPSPSVPPTMQPNRDKNAQHSHTQTYQH